MKSPLDLNVAKDFAVDVWEDLKHAGLAGIAVALAITLVAISAIVLKPGGPPAIDTGYASAAAAPPEQVALAMPGEKPLRISDIDLSAPRDPFRTLDQLDASSSSGGGSTQSVSDMTTAPTSQPSSGGSGGGPAGGSPTTVAVDRSEELVPLGNLETARPVSEEPRRDDGQQGEPKGKMAPDKKGSAPPATDYSYAADVQFGAPGSLKRYRSVQRLGFVPSRSNPMLMYLGVKADHETAVFMVDSRLSQGGEGKCVPRPSLCTFIELSTSPARDEHRFRDADDNEYLLRLRGVVRTAASAGSVGGPDVPALPNTPAVVDGSR